MSNGIRNLVTIGFALACALRASAGVDVSMTFGRIAVEGFPGPTVVTGGGSDPRNVSGSGSTGGGLGGTGDLLASIKDDSSLHGNPSTRLRVTGDCDHGAQFGYTAMHTIDDNEFHWHIEVTLNEEVQFAVLNASTASATNGGVRKPIAPVEFTALTGTITGSVATGGTLSPGTYAVRIWLGGFVPSAYGLCRMQSGYSAFSTSGVHDAVADWTLVLTPIPTCIATDLDCNGVVDSGDIAMALLDYGPCPGCAGDVDGNGVIDFGDVALIMLDFG